MATRSASGSATTSAPVVSGPHSHFCPEIGEEVDARARRRGSRRPTARRRRARARRCRLAARAPAAIAPVVQSTWESASSRVRGVTAPRIASAVGSTTTHVARRRRASGSSSPGCSSVVVTTSSPGASPRPAATMLQPSVVEEVSATCSELRADEGREPTAAASLAQRERALEVRHARCGPPPRRASSSTRIASTVATGERPERPGVEVRDRARAPGTAPGPPRSVSGRPVAPSAASMASRRAFCLAARVASGGTPGVARRPAAPTAPLRCRPCTSSSPTPRLHAAVRPRARRRRSRAPAPRSSSSRRRSGSAPGPTPDGYRLRETLLPVSSAGIDRRPLAARGARARAPGRDGAAASRHSATSCTCSGSPRPELDALLLRSRGAARLHRARPAPAPDGARGRGSGAACSGASTGSSSTASAGERRSRRFGVDPRRAARRCPHPVFRSDPPRRDDGAHGARARRDPPVQGARGRGRRDRPRSRTHGCSSRAIRGSRSTR